MSMPEPVDMPASEARFLRRIADGYLALSFLYISLMAVRDLKWGGNAWKQGDWLINTAGGDVRRGDFGSAVIALGDLLGTGPVLTVVGLQIGLLALLFLGFRHLAMRVPDPRVSALILVSPAIFTVFWVADPQGSLRKEVIACAALCLVAVGATQGRRLPLWCGVALLCVSFLAHEAMVLLLPAFLGVLVVSGLFDTDRGHAMAAGAVGLGIGVYALSYALSHARIADADAVCLPLLVRGVSPSLCTGAIEWLEYDAARGYREVLLWMAPENVTGFLIAYLLALAPWLYLAGLTLHPARNAVLVVALGLPFLPLYPVSVDWGRWMSLHLFSVTILAICALSRGRLRLRQRPAMWVVAVCLVLSLLVSPVHTVGMTPGGVIGQLVSQF